MGAFPVFWRAVQFDVEGPDHDDVVGGTEGAVVVVDTDAWFSLAGRGGGGEEAEDFFDYGCGVGEVVEKFGVLF